MRQFYGRLEKCVLSAGKTHVHKIPRFRGGGIFGFGGGGSVDFIFMGARIFLNFGGSEMPLNIVFLRPRNWSRLKPYNTKALLPPPRCSYRYFSRRIGHSPFKICQGRAHHEMQTVN